MVISNFFIITPDSAFGVDTRRPLAAGLDSTELVSGWLLAEKLALTCFQSAASSKKPVANSL
jgi:hypothetical protein